MNSPLSNTQFSELIKKFLKAIDNYNSSDLTRSTPNTDQNTTGEVAAICLNLALGVMYDLIKDSKYLQAPPVQTLKSTANQDWIDLDIEPYLDEVETITDLTNNFKLVRKSWSWYKRNFPDSSQTSGIPVYYIRRFDRLYLAPRPASSITYETSYIKNQGDLVSDGDLPLLPTHYDYWIISEAMIEWAKMEDPKNIAPILIQERDDKRAIAINAIMSNYDNESQGESHWNAIGDPLGLEYQSPIGS